MDKRRGIGSDSPAKDRAGYTGALPGYRKGLSGIRKACLICQHLFDPLEIWSSSINWIPKNCFRVCSRLPMKPLHNDLLPFFNLNCCLHLVAGSSLFADSCHSNRKFQIDVLPDENLFRLYAASSPGPWDTGVDLQWIHIASR